MNILIVHNYYQIPGGEDTVVANEKQMLEENENNVIMYSRSNAEIAEMCILRKIILPISSIFNIRTYIEICEIIRREKIDIVHVHNTIHLISASVYYAAIHCHIPVVQTIHNFRLVCPGATFYRNNHICEDCVEKGMSCAVKHGCYRNSRTQTLLSVIGMKLHRLTGVYKKIKYICLTEFNKEKLLQFNQIKEEQIYVKPNFTFEPSVYSETATDYLFIGRMEDIKGVPIVIEAFKKLPDKRLILAGTGSMLEKYMEQTREYKNIEFKGFVDKEDLQIILKQIKAVIVASQWYETFGMIVVEAFASRVPVIVGDIGNVGDLVDDLVNGVKFRYDSPEDLVKAIYRFEQLDRNKLSKNAYSKYQKEFGKDRNYHMLEKIYNNMLKEGKNP